MKRKKLLQILWDKYCALIEDVSDIANDHDLNDFFDTVLEDTPEDEKFRNALFFSGVKIIADLQSVPMTGRDMANKMYIEVADSIKKSTLLALRWAERVLLDRHGVTHSFCLKPTKEMMVKCLITELEANTTYSGSEMESGSKAIVMATCEYLQRGYEWEKS